MTHYQDELALVNHLVERLEHRLSGRHTKRLVNRLPVDECHLGVLVPWRSPEEPDAVDSENLSEDPSVVVSPATRLESPGQPSPAGVETSAPPASDRAQRAPEQGSSASTPVRVGL